VNKRTKAYSLYEEGIKQLGKVPETFEELGQLFAILVVANSSQGSSAKYRRDPEAVEFLDTLIESAGTSIITDPFDTSWYTLCSWKLRDTQLTLEDAEAIGQWLAAGHWYGNKPTVKQILYNLADLAARSRESGGYDPRYRV
jgi:hypothetical protein